MPEPIASSIDCSGDKGKGTMAISFRDAATTMLIDRGWLCIPLRKDANGFAKIPISQGWPSLETSLQTVESLEWEKAEGLGIVLGEKSNNLAVLDVDDEALADAIMLYCWDRLDTSPRMVRTARNRLHIYYQEVGYPSNSSKQIVKVDGRDVTVELKANGTQVAAPPTPRYRLANHPQEPAPTFSIAQSWELIVDCLNNSPFRDRLQLTVDSFTGKRYPEPWQEEVKGGERNESAYVEAHRLRETGMTLDQALKIMYARFREDYDQQGITWEEIKRTVESAYMKGVVVNDHRGNEFKLFGI